MAEKRILFLGAQGQLGQAFGFETKPPDWHYIGATRAECDITHTSQLRNYIQAQKPDLVINAAAMTAVDQCEHEKDAARAANFEGPANLAAQCSAIDAPLIHLSTDYVFDGTETRPYTPLDPMNPLSAYGETKMLGEEALRHETAWHVILRVSSVYSAYRQNILTKALKNIDERDELKVVTDQRSCPTYAPDIAKALITIADAILRGKTDGFGTFHLCGADALNRFEFMQSIMAAYAPHTTHRPRILPALSSDFPGFAVRPAYSVLDCTKILRVYGIEQMPWQEGLESALRIILKARGESA